MQELVWLAEPIRIWIEGGTWADIKAAHGFQMLAVMAAMLVPSTIIGLGIGMTDWHETPLGFWFGARAKAADRNWVERACDLDGDGVSDI